MEKISFSDKQIAAQSKNNLTGYITLTIAYLKQTGQSPEEWLHFIGSKFLQTWPDLPKASLKDIAGGIILNNLSGGARLVSLEGDDTQVEILLEGWPSQDYLNLAGISWEEAQLIHEVLTPVFAEVALNYQWETDNKQVKIILSRLN